ncbi:hypothetical protein [uncultured Microbacterium sp.]|uniref:hypothetical protein n=1 Tax=uncultured Microbacterium sp. TaxID=191216 RepID=UPI0035CAEA6D
MVTLYTITLTVACCIAVALVLGSARSRTADEGPSNAESWVTTSLLAVLSASAATLSTLAYAMAGTDGANLVPLLIGDVSMPLAAGLLLAAMRRASGHSRLLAVPILIVSFGVAAVTLFVSPEAGQTVKLLVIAALNVLTVVTCVRGRERLGLLGAWLIGGTVGLYAAYCVMRLITPVVFEHLSDTTFTLRDRATLMQYLGQGGASIVSAAAVAVITAGVIVIVRRGTGGQRSTTIVSNEALTDWIAALLVERREVTAIATSVPDIALHRAAFGRPWAQAISAAVTETTRLSLPAGSIIGRPAPGVLVAIEFGVMVELDSIRSRMQEMYEGMLPRTAPTEAPDLFVERVIFTEPHDLRRFARRARAASRRAMAMQGR